MKIKMKLRITLLVVLLLTLIGSLAFADTSLSEVIEDVNIANAEIEALVQEAIEDADEAKLDNINDLAEFENELDEIISELLEEVDEIATEAIEEAAEGGFTVYCELIEMEIHGIIVMIDPLIVGGL